MNAMAQHEHQAPARTLVQLSKAEVMAAFASRECPACAAKKQAGETFCRTDYLALPLHLRNWLARGPADAYFPLNYNRALNHLRLQPTRVVRVLASGARWRYDSHESLVAAGYRLIEYARCAVPRCYQHIAWYWTPARKRIAINIPSYTPHTETCRDPEYFARRRALRTSAKRRRRQA